MCWRSQSHLRLCFLLMIIPPTNIIAQICSLSSRYYMLSFYELMEAGFFQRLFGKKKPKDPLEPFRGITPDTMWQSPKSQTFFYMFRGPQLVISDNPQMSHMLMILDPEFGARLLPGKWRNVRADDDTPPREQVMEKGALAGRIGYIDKVKVVAIWNEEQEDYRYLEPLLKELHKKGIIDACTVIKPIIHDPFLAHKYIGGECPHLDVSKEDDPCKNVKFTMGGISTKLPELMAKLHTMAGKGGRIESEFCSKAPQLQQKFQDCPSELDQIKSVYNRIKCGQETYEKKLGIGKAAYLQWLRQCLGDEDCKEREFRTQGELNKAFDMAYPKWRECTLNFKEWLK